MFKNISNLIFNRSFNSLFQFQMLPVNPGLLFPFRILYRDHWYFSVFSAGLCNTFRCERWPGWSYVTPFWRMTRTGSVGGSVTFSVVTVQLFHETLLKEILRKWVNFGVRGLSILIFPGKVGFVCGHSSPFCCPSSILHSLVLVCLLPFGKSSPLI